MSPFPRPDYAPLEPYEPGRTPVEVDLSDNTNLWGPHPAARRLLENPPSDLFTRYPSPYAADLKAAVARRFGVGTENVTTGCGSDDLLDSAFRAATVPPGTLVHLEPTFSVVGAFARMNGLETRAVPWAQAAQDPASLVAGNPAVLYLCRPDNPTGLLLPRGWVHELLDLVGPAGPVVVLDEAYADFAGESFASQAPAFPRLLVVRTLSKLYGLAGLRVGYAVGAPELVREVEKSRGPYKVGRLAEAAAVLALKDEEGWGEEILALTVENRERLEDELRRRGLRPLPSRANFLLVPVAPRNARSLHNALKVRGVAVRPFPALPGVGEALRVTVGPWPLMERFLQALDEALGDDVTQEGREATGRRFP